MDTKIVGGLPGRVWELSVTTTFIFFFFFFLFVVDFVIH